MRMQALFFFLGGGGGGEGACRDVGVQGFPARLGYACKAGWDRTLAVQIRLVFERSTASFRFWEASRKLEIKALRLTRKKDEIPGQSSRIQECQNYQPATIMKPASPAIYVGMGEPAWAPTPAWMVSYGHLSKDNCTSSISSKPNWNLPTSSNYS